MSDKRTGTELSLSQYLRQAPAEEIAALAEILTHDDEEKAAMAAPEDGETIPPPDEDQAPPMDSDAPMLSAEDLIVMAVSEKLDRHPRTGKPYSEPPNYETVLSSDPRFSGLRYNAFAHRQEVIEGGELRRWTDADDAESMMYISRTYQFHNEKNYQLAMRARQRAISYDPLREMVESIQWDGKHRITDFLTKWAKAPNDPYTHEVSRLIFAGGINRLLHSGCKFDEVAVLVGKQGSGKSTLVRWLAMSDTFFGELVTLEGKEGIEGISGVWICEISELLAMKSARAVESVKSYLSRLTDRYRPAYGHQTEEFPRCCVFVGTSNEIRFNADLTGGRRFYPVNVGSTATWLYSHEDECHEYIRQCWAEALAAYNSTDPAFHSLVRPYPDPALADVINEQQAATTIIDERVGMIESWLERCECDVVCTSQISYEALGQRGNGNNEPKLTKAESREIGNIMDSFPGWVYCGDSKRNFPGFGRQRYWKRIKR